MANSLIFDGSTTVVTAPNATALNFTGNYTISVWIKFSALPNNTNYISKYDNTDGFVMGSDNLAKTQYGFKKAGSWALSTGVSAVTTGSWFHLVSVYDGANIKLYTNNSAATGAGVTGTIGVNTDLLRVGINSNWGGGKLNGLMSRLRIWNTSLSAGQISALYTYDTVPGSGLVLQWLLGEGSGSTANDTAGTNTGTITGATWSTDVPTFSSLANNSGFLAFM